MFLKGSEQNFNVDGLIRECDWCSGKMKPNEKGYAHTCKGATGRHCEVMWACDECGDKMVEKGQECISLEEARKRATNPETGEYPDF